MALQARQQIAAIDREIAVAIHLAFYFPRPASLAKRVTRHIRKPDFDKLIRAAADAFTSVLYIDDAQADEAHIYKRYAGGALDPLGSNGTPRMVVKVLAQEDAIAKTPPLFEEKSTSVSPAAPPKRARKPKPVRVEVGF